MSDGQGAAQREKDHLAMEKLRKRGREDLVYHYETDIPFWQYGDSKALDPADAILGTDGERQILTCPECGCEWWDGGIKCAQCGGPCP